MRRLTGLQVWAALFAFVVLITVATIVVLSVRSAAGDVGPATTTVRVDPRP